MRLFGGAGLARSPGVRGYACCLHGDVADYRRRLVDSVPEDVPKMPSRGARKSVDALTKPPALWHKLSDGAAVIQALAPADWAPAYRMLTDRFDITWIFGVTSA